MAAERIPDRDDAGAGYAPHAQGTHAQAGQHAHEETDVRVRPIVVAAAGLSAILVLALVVVQLLFHYFAVREGRRSPPANPLAGAYGRQVPPEPRLQTEPREDLVTLRAREDERLHGYAWMDRDAGVARIPIERAIDLLAGRGLPARAQPSGGEHP